MGSRTRATPVPRRRTPATQAGQWGSQPPHRQTDREATVAAAPDAHPSSHPPRQRLGDAAWTLDFAASISVRVPTLPLLGFSLLPGAPARIVQFVPKVQLSRG